MKSGMHRTGFGFEFEVATDATISSYWKEGQNAGVSGILSHFPSSDVTFVVLSNLEDGAWEPIKSIETIIEQVAASDDGPADPDQGSGN